MLLPLHVHIHKNDFGVQLPTRSRANVIRCRGINSSDYRYPEERWDTIKMVLKATGCRRMEVLRLRREDFRTNKDGNLEVYKRGKGGIERWCLVNPKYTDQIKEWYRTTPSYKIDGEDRLVLKSELPRGAIHDLRADYARDLYEYFEARGDVETGEIYPFLRIKLGILLIITKKNIFFQREAHSIDQVIFKIPKAGSSVHAALKGSVQDKIGTGQCLLQSGVHDRSRSDRLLHLSGKSGSDAPQIPVDQGKTV